MSKFHQSISPDLVDFIAAQKIFFTATAPREGRINLSPKGLDSFRILGPNRVCWLNLTGSGNETAAHLLQDERITVMFCAFEGKPLILRLYGRARAVHPRDTDYSGLLALFERSAGARQIIDMQVESVNTSCGFGVPLMDYAGDRQLLPDWYESKGPEGIEAYKQEKNVVSFDGAPTGLFDPPS